MDTLILKNRLEHVDILRGFAALSVVWFHLTGSSGSSEEIASMGKLGYLGVEVFFVISGFIIPISMANRAFVINKFWQFIGKRIIRLDPPFLASMAIGVALPYITMGAGYSPPSAAQILGHLGYLNAILGLDWISPVYWTLAIEFQFYIFVGIIFPLANASNSRIAIPLFTILALVPLLSQNTSLLPYWIGLFLIGMCGFRILTHKEKWPIIIAVTSTFIASHTVGTAEALAGSLALIFLLFGQSIKFGRAKDALLWVGGISYSLYLTHWNIGITAIAAARYLPFARDFEIAVVILGVLASLAGAKVLYIIIERPSINWANTYKPYSNSKAGFGTTNAPP